jgi:general secretion pathway protein D
LSEPTPAKSAAGANEVPVQSPPVHAQSSNNNKKMVSFHFEDADLEVVLRALADVAGINFVLGPGAKGKVTLLINRVPSSEAFTIFQNILEANNLVAIKSGSLYKIVTAAQAPQQPTAIGMGQEATLNGEEGFMTQFVSLRYLSAEELVKVVQPLVAPGKVLPYRDTNSLIFTASASTIKRLMQIIQALDVQGKQRELQQTYVYYVEHAKAKDLAATLTSVFEDKRRERTLTAVRQESLKPPATAPPQPPRPGTGAPPVETALPSTAVAVSEEARITGEIRIVADEVMNALVIKATSQDYQALEEVIKKLDVTPKQVVIEVFVAEVTLTDNFSFGLESFLKAGDVALQQFFGLGPVPANLVKGVATNVPGFTLTFVDKDRFKLFLNSLSQDTNINTLATPHILTQNNKEAKIQVGQEVPIVTGTQARSTGAPSDQVFQTIQQRDVGRILVIKPHVNEKRQVTLDVQIEVTDVLSTTTVSGTPSFSKRTAQTSVVVDDGQSLLIGGIISSGRRFERSGLPWLSKIPILGYLFGTTTDNTDKTELFIMLTPHVVANPEEGAQRTEEFRRRLDWLEEQFKRSRRPAEQDQWRLER